ncbi:MAG: DUF4099 domain-containing protein [Alistipes sp.]|nr:DUF4099 domain-containing protein [Candidatus Alistipes equi]
MEEIRIERLRTYTEDEINWDELQAIGISSERLSKMGEMESLLKGRRTRPFLITPTIFGYSIDMEVTLQMEDDTTGRPIMRIEGIHQNK